MRVLVTGAGGFIGRAFALRLASAGTAVRAFARAGSDMTMLEQAGVEVVRGDIRERSMVLNAIRGCSHVMHLAAQKTQRGVAASAYHDTNVTGTQHVIDACLQHGVARLVYVSTLGVHGFVTGGVLDESSPLRPNTPYRHTKLLGEQLVVHQHLLKGLPAVVARISSVVGPGAKGWLPLARGIDSERITLIGGGSNYIDLVSLDDMLDGLTRCLITPDIDGRCYVLGAGAPVTMNTFSELIARAVCKTAPRRGPPLLPYRVVLRGLSLVYRRTSLHTQFGHSREVLVASKRTSSQRAMVELGYHPAPRIDSAVESMIRQFVHDGLLPSSRSSGAGDVGDTHGKTTR